MPSSQGAPSGSLNEQLSLGSSQRSEQSGSPSGPGQGSPTPPQTPPVQVSTSVQNKPSSQTEPFGSAVVQLFAPSLHDSVQSPSPSAFGHGSSVPTQVPALQASVAVQNRPSVQAVASGSGARQLSAPSL